MSSEPEQEVARRFRLMLGQAAESEGEQGALNDKDAKMDAALGALYDFERTQKFDYPGEKGKGSSEASRPAIARWLGDIRQYFPQSVVEVMQKDALRQTALRQKLLLEPEILEQAIPDVHLVATLMELSKKSSKPCSKNWNKKRFKPSMEPCCAVYVAVGRVIQK
jgi:hypothetical protein